MGIRRLHHTHCHQVIAGKYCGGPVFHFQQTVGAVHAADDIKITAQDQRRIILQTVRFQGSFISVHSLIAGNGFFGTGDAGNPFMPQADQVLRGQFPGIKIIDQDRVEIVSGAIMVN